jgi:hypothetical protein
VYRIKLLFTGGWKGICSIRGFSVFVPTWGTIVLSGRLIPNPTWLSFSITSKGLRRRAILPLHWSEVSLSIFYSLWKWSIWPNVQRIHLVKYLKWNKSSNDSGVGTRWYIENNYHRRNNGLTQYISASRVTLEWWWHTLQKYIYWVSQLFYLWYLN